MTIQQDMLKISGDLGRLSGLVEAAATDSQETRKDVKGLREDISELMQLGARVAGLEKHQRDHCTDIDALNGWKNRHLGFDKALHFMWAAALAILSAAVTMFNWGKSPHL